MQCTCSTRFYIYFSDALVSGVTSRPVDLQINTLDIEIRVSARRSIIVEVRDVPKRRLRRWWPFNDHRGIRTLWSGDYYVGSRYTDKGSWWRCGEFHSCQNALFGISVSDLWSVFYRKMVASLLRVLKLLEMPLHGCKTTMAASSASFLFQQMVVLSRIMGLFFLDGLFLQGCIDHQGWRVTPRISELWQWDKCCWIERKELILPVFSKSSLCAVSQTCTPVMSLSAFSIRFRSTPPTTQLWTDNKKHRIQQQNRDWMHSAVFPYRPYRVVYLSLRLSP